MENKKTKSVRFGKQILTVEESHYSTNNAKAVILKQKNGETYCVLSTNLDNLPNENCFWLKDWSENSELAEFMLENNFLELTGRSELSGFVIAKEAKLNL